MQVVFSLHPKQQQGFNIIKSQILGKHFTPICNQTPFLNCLVNKKINIFVQINELQTIIMRKIQLLFGGLFLLMASISFAGNPVTTNFSTFYSHIDKVNLAQQLGKLDGAVATYILDESVSLENKAAVINAMYVDPKADFNASSFRMYVARRIQGDWQNLDLGQLSGDELFCLAYLTILDKPSDPQAAFVIFERAKEKSSSSFIINLFYSLTQAQIFADDNNYCEAYKVCEDVRSNTSLTKDFGDAATNVVFESVNEYQEKCK